MKRAFSVITVAFLCLFFTQSFTTPVNTKSNDQPQKAPLINRDRFLSSLGITGKSLTTNNMLIQNHWNANVDINYVGFPGASDPDVIIPGSQVASGNNTYIPVQVGQAGYYSFVVNINVLGPGHTENRCVVITDALGTAQCHLINQSGNYRFDNVYISNGNDLIWVNVEGSDCVGW
jgi:hypothetical protein